MAAHLDSCVSCHAWNGDGSMLAWSPNSNELHIGNEKGEKKFSMTEHDQVITGVDWSPASNLIVTSSQDRNAYVWQFDEAAKVWRPTLVILRINRAATCVKWSPKGDKFAVGSGAKCVSICYFEEEYDWWVSKHIKKPIRSTVLSVDWHPNNILIAAGSSDFKCRIFSGFVKDLDKKKDAITSWSELEKLPFGELLCEIDTGAGWVHDVKFSPSGDELVAVTHASSVVFATPGSSQILPLKQLPLKVCAYLNADTIVAAGYDCQPYVFSRKGGVWEFSGTADKKHEAAAAKKTTGTAAAFARFQTTARTGVSAENKKNETKMETKHQNAISCLAVRKQSGDKVTEFTTTGYDGALVCWPTQTLAQAISGLSL